MKSPLRNFAAALASVLAFAVTPAVADVPFGGTQFGTDPLGHSWSTGASGDFLAWGEPGLGLGVLSFNPLGGIVDGLSTSATQLDFTFLNGSPGIDNVNPTPSLTGFDLDTRMINVTKGFFFNPFVSLDNHRISFIAPEGMTLDVGDSFFVNVHFDAPLDTATFSFAGDWIYAPVPEPETYAMLLAGLALMGFVARRRQRSQAA
jgi:hypothetical protein